MCIFTWSKIFTSISFASTTSFREAVSMTVLASSSRCFLSFPASWLDSRSSYRFLQAVQPAAIHFLERQPASHVLASFIASQPSSCLTARQPAACLPLKPWWYLTCDLYWCSTLLEVSTKYNRTHGTESQHYSCVVSIVLVMGEEDNKCCVAGRQCLHPD